MNKINKVVFGSYMVDFSRNGLVFKANDDFFKLTGYTKADLEAGTINFFNFIPDSEREEYLAVVNASGNDLCYIRHRFVRKDKSIMYVLCFGQNREDNASVAEITIIDYTYHMDLLSKYNQSKSELEIISNYLPGGVAIVSCENDKLKICKCNNELMKMLGATDYSHRLSDYFDGADSAEIKRQIINSMTSDQLISIECKLSNAKSNVKWVKIYGKKYTDVDGMPMVYLMLFDVTKEKAMTEQLKISARRFELLSESTNEIYFDYNISDDSLTLNSMLCRYQFDEYNAIPNFMGNAEGEQYIYSFDYVKLYDVYKDAIKHPRSGSFEYRTKAFDDDYTWYRVSFVSVEDDDGNMQNIFGKLYNIEHMKNMKQRIESDSEYLTHLLSTDSITGLLNRKTFVAKATDIMKNPDADYVYGIAYSDLNDFSYINDNFGYEAGNKMLTDFGGVIKDLDENILACRIYSDFFVGLYRAKSRDKLINSIISRNKIFMNMQKSIYTASDVRISCGMYIFGEESCNIETAIDNANLARKNVKGCKSIKCGLYSTRLRQQRAYEQEIATSLHSAIENNQIEMFLQPKFSMKTNKIIGAEALARWKNYDGTYKMPFEFIAVLEKIGYIDELDFCIYEQALKAMKEWKTKYNIELPVSVNFSQHHINKMETIDRIIELADKYGLDKKYIEIEVTESCFSDDVHSLYTDLKKLRDNGLRVDIDDFGIGYSTLNILINAPADIVKIDKSFIDNIVSNKVDREYVKNMCRLIETVDKDIIFEGVETREQADILCDCGHIKAQGWLFDKAMPLDDFNRKYISHN